MGFDGELKNILNKKTKNFPRTLVLGLQWVSVGYSSALYFAGKKFGKETVAPTIKSNDLKGILKDAGTVFKSLGIGTLGIKEAQENRAVLTLKNGTTAHGMSSVGKPICFFECGLIAGILEGRLKKNVTVNETMCGGLGDSEEEFIVKM